MAWGMLMGTRAGEMLQQNNNVNREQFLQNGGDYCGQSYGKRKSGWRLLHVAARIKDPIRRFSEQGRELVTSKAKCIVANNGEVDELHKLNSKR